VLAGGGDDRVEGGDGDDVLLGQAGDDCLVGGAGDDFIAGGDGDDELHGSAGDDQLLGGKGRDDVKGNAGDDIVKVDADRANDAYDGGSGRDTLDLGALECDTLVDLVQGRLSGIDAGDDTIRQFEVVIGGSGDDTLVISNETATTMSGGRGRDTFKFEVEGRDAAEDAGELIHRILDLEVGDRIVVSQYTLRRDDDDDGREDECGDDFGRIYGDDEDDGPFRFRIEKIGEHESTFIDVEIENDADKDLSIEISGAHRFYYYA
jgi:Ca2+-binding RTX toxin-like protein